MPSSEGRDRLIVDRGRIRAVLFIGNMPPPVSGAHAQEEELARRLAEASWSVLTVSHRAGRIGRFVDILASIWKWRGRYDVAGVAVFSGLAFRWAEAACLLLHMLHKPYVLILHGGNLPAFARAQTRRVRRLLASAAAVTTPSRFLLEGMRPYREDVRLVPNALSTRRFAFRLREQPSPRLIWVRAFHKVYNPTLGPRVVAALAPSYPGAHLTMIGRDKDGSLADVRRIAAELGVADRIALPGPVPNAEIGAWLDRADVFLNTTNVDNTPVSVLEAQAAGLCVVTTNVGGIPYLLDHGSDALLVPPDDAGAMAGAVRRLFTEPELAKTLSQNGRRKAERFDWDVVVPQWEQILGALGDAEGR